jgi:IS605 OrfB family transposase
MPKKNENWDVMRCQALRFAVPLDEKTAKFYSDMQSDFNDLYPRMMMWSLIPHIQEDKDGIVKVKHVDDVLTELKKDVPAELLEDVLLIGDVISRRPRDEASSFYGLFSKSYKSTGKANFNDAKIKFLNSLGNLTDEELSVFISKDESFKLMSVAEWRTVQADIDSGTKIKKAWEKISKKIANKVNASYARVRNAFKQMSRQPNSRGYCSTLAELLRRQISSAYKKYVVHLADGKKISEQSAIIQKSNEVLFNAIAELWNRLDALGNGLSEKTLMRAVKMAAEKEDPLNSNIEEMATEVQKPEFDCIIKADHKDVRKAYRGVKLKRRYDQRKIYPSMSSLKNDQKIPFGLTSLANFEAKMSEGRLIVSFEGGPGLACQRSHYFNDLDCVKIANKKHYQITFNHRLKSKKKYAVSKKYIGVIKEIGLQQKNGSYYITLPYTLTHSPINRNLECFFKTAQPDVKKYDLPDEIRVAGFDLNVGDPLVGGIAVFKKNGDGPLIALDYGKGHMVQQPETICPDTKLSNRIRALTKITYKIVHAIRGYKKSVNNNMPLDEKIESFLKKIKSPSPVIRCRIQTWVKQIGIRLRKLHHLVRASGYKELSESLRLLEAQDAMKSLIESFKRIHLKKGQSLPKKKEFDTTRQNFRKDISRRYASKVIQYSKGCNLIVIEDLKSDFDRDNKNNSLLRLFSSGSLIKSIQDAAHKEGIGVVLADPAGTSRTDCVTGEIGYRNTKIDKTRLYVVRDGVLGTVNADKNAVINVIARGVGHSVVPYKVFVRSTVEKTTVEDEEEKNIGKRVKRFYTTLYGSTKPVFTLEDNKTIKVVKKASKKMQKLTNCYIYVRGKRLVTEAEHRAEEKRIENRVTSGEISVGMKLEPCPVKGFLAFKYNDK